MIWVVKIGIGKAAELLNEMMIRKSRIQKRRSRARNNERTGVDEDVANEPKRKDSEEVLPRQENVRTEKDMLHDLILTPSFPLIPSPHTTSPNQIRPSPSQTHQ